ncbi:unnamed protein product [Prunus armeniaca]
MTMNKPNSEFRASKAADLLLFLSALRLLRLTDRLTRTRLQNSSPSPLLLFIRPVFGLPSPPPATPSDNMGIKRTSTLSFTSLKSQPLPTAVWIAEKGKKLAGFYLKSPSLVRAIPSTICFDPCMVFQPLELFLLLVVLVRRNF